MSNLLPLGSIVKKQDRLFMLVGYLPQDKKIHMYSAVPYPLGMLEKEVIYTIDENEFEVEFKGYSDDLTEQALNGIELLIRELAARLTK